jgi:hypothetical protein
MKTRLLNALRRGVVFYPCSGNDFEMINTINNYNLNSKDFIYCDSGNLNANVGVAENIDNLEVRIRERFEILRFVDADIGSIYPIENIYRQLAESNGDEYNTYVEGIQNRVTLYKLKNWDEVEFNLFYFRAESLALFHWLNSLKSEKSTTGENTLVINAPGGGWLYTAEFIALLNEQSQFFNVRATYDWHNDPPYHPVNQN